MNISSLISSLEPPMTRVQKIHRENERSNLLTVTRLVLRSFLDQAMRSSNRMIEGDSQQLSDLLMMLEKVLFHGFKPIGQKSLLRLTTPDADLWAAIMRIGKTNSAMLETTNCVEQIASISTPIARVRAFLRLSIMQKKLADFFDIIARVQFLNDFYESWALIQQDNFAALSGALIGLTVLECSLTLDQDHLQDQPASVELSMYVRIPLLSNEEETAERSIEHQKATEKQMKLLLDQNSYLEERNKQLESNIANMKLKLKAADEETGSIILDQDCVSFKSLKTESNSGSPIPPPSPPKAAKEKEWNEEKERLIAQIAERDDSLRISQQQLFDTKRVSVDLYDKLRFAEESCQILEKDIWHLRTKHSTELETLQKSILSLEAANNSLNERISMKTADDDAIRVEFDKKVEQYSQTMATLETKQMELWKVQAELSAEKKKIEIMETKLKELPSLNQELHELGEKYEATATRAEELERTLQEMGGHLSESKLRIVELAEELLPNAHWAKDSEVHQCSACSENFSLTKRKHHCRVCGCIFCYYCSEARVKLPSTPKPARCCEACYNNLKYRQSVVLPSSTN